MKGFYKQTLITDYFEPIYKLKVSNKKSKIVYGYNKNTDSWHCLTCGIDMGFQNPRQLCGKSFCLYKY